MSGSGQALQKPIACSHMPENSQKFSGGDVALSSSINCLGPIRDHMVTIADAFRARRRISCSQIGRYIPKYCQVLIADCERCGCLHLSHLKDIGRVAKCKIICSTAVALIRRADFIFDVVAYGLQVTSLALCKVNKSEMLLRRLNQHFRHKRTEELFWKNDEVPAEALKILQVSSF